MSDPASWQIVMEKLRCSPTKEIAKTVKKIGEESKVAIRNVRRDSNEVIKEQEKAKTLTEDQSKKLQEQIQKTTDQFVGEVDKVIEAKTKDIMTL